MPTSSSTADTMPLRRACLAAVISLPPVRLLVVLPVLPVVPLLLVVSVGCGTNESTDVQAVHSAQSSSTSTPAGSDPHDRTRPADDPESAPGDAPPGIGPGGVGWRYQQPAEGRSLGDLLAQAPAPTETTAVRVPINETLVASAGIRKLDGQHITLYTDLPSDDHVDELPQVFDQAVPHWRQYFALDQSKLAEWKIIGYVIQDREKFRAVGLLPDDLPPFLHAYQRGEEIWVYEQPSAYFRRHLLLHEGTHSVMNHLLGGSGPPWYMESIAELLGTHHWENGRLQMGYVPRNKEEVPYWGRVKIVRDHVDAGRAKALSAVMAHRLQDYLQVDPYGWSWAAAAFLDAHPLSQEAFRQLGQRTDSVDFSARFRQQLDDEWPRLAEQWQLFVMNIDYGYDVAREAVIYGEGESFVGETATAEIVVDRGWQSSGVRLEADRSYRIEATGRYQVASEPRTWWCEPNGVTIRYHGGQPLGILLAAIRDDQPAERLTSLARPVEIGLGRTITPGRSGTLYLRINDHPAELADNEGTVTVTVRVLP